MWVHYIDTTTTSWLLVKLQKNVCVHNICIFSNFLTGVLCRLTGLQNVLEKAQIFNVHVQ